MRWMKEVGFAGPRVGPGFLFTPWLDRHEGGRGDLFFALRQHEIDFAVVPGGLTLRRFRLLACDMDSTLIESETMVELANLAGVGQQVSALTLQAITDPGHDYAASMRYRIGLLRGTALSDVHELIEHSCPLAPGARELIHAAAAAGLRSAIVSGGFQLIAQPLRQALGIDEAFAHELEIAHETLTGTLLGEVIDAQGKADILASLCKRNGFSPQQVIAVGDGANDMEMARFCGLFVGFRPQAALLPACDIVLDHTGLDGIIHALACSEQIGSEAFPHSLHTEGVE